MDRNQEQNTINFTPAEQAEFGVDPTVSVESALQTADVFNEIADKLYTKIETPAEESDRKQVVEWRLAEARAMRLRNVAVQIMMLCPAEVISHVLDNLPPKDR